MPTPPLQRPLADWLDAPIQRLRAHRRALSATLTTCILLVIAITGIGQAPSVVSGDPNAMSTSQLGVMMLGVGVAAILTGALVTLVEMVACVGVDSVARGERLTMSELLRRAVQRPLVTAAVVRMLFHLSMAILTIISCGIGLIVWLVAYLYIPLVFPVAVREGVGGLQAHLRSVNLINWRPRGGPWYGSVDRVVVAVHVVAGLAYALWALPNLPSLAWMGVTAWELITSGAVDPLTIQEQLVPPIWLTLPVQLASNVLGLLTTLYSQQLYLDLHADLRDAREGHDLHAALDRLGAPTADG